MPRKPIYKSNRRNRPSTSKSKKRAPKVEEVDASFSKCEISTPEVYTPAGPTILCDEIDPILHAKWPKLDTKIPPIFLHNYITFEEHVKKIISLGVKFYQPHRGKNYVKVICESLHDHKYLTNYLDKKQLPYHTYSNPSKRKMKVVIRGLPYNVEESLIKEELKSHSIPVIRVHKMKTRDTRKESGMLALIVIPHNDEGKTLLKVTQLLGHKVTLEPPHTKPKQCYRCQQWGHSQRYCHGLIVCVKCSGYHWSKKCETPREKIPKCANCCNSHTASYRKCVLCPASVEYQKIHERTIEMPCYMPRHLVTMKNYETLYRNVVYVA